VVAGGPAAVDLAGTRVELHQWMGGDGSAVWKNGYRTMYGGHTDVVATTGSDGSFRLDLRKSGRYVIVAKPPPALAGTSAAAELGPLDLDVHAARAGSSCASARAARSRAESSRPRAKARPVASSR
jgi:hypothetical protein